MTTLTATEVAVSERPEVPVAPRRGVSVGRVIAWIGMILIMLFTLAPF